MIQIESVFSIVECQVVASEATARALVASSSRRHTGPLASGDVLTQMSKIEGKPEVTNRRIRNCDITTMASSSDPSQSPCAATQPLPHSEKFWDVQAILAERHSRFQTGSEVLVAWKPCWIPIENVPDGPIMSSYREAPKARFLSSVGKVILPVEPDTALADDVASAAHEADRQIYPQEQQRRAQRGTPRKSLGSVAKRAPVKNPRTKPKKQ